MTLQVELMHSTGTTVPIPDIYRQDRVGWAAVIGGLALLLITFHDGLSALVLVWNTFPEYSYGYLIPFISVFLVWQRKDRLEQVVFTGAWAGVALVAIGLALLGLGRISTLGTLLQYSFLTVLAGMVLAWSGGKSFRLFLVPLLILFFMVPLPNIVMRELSAALQLISSQLGVAVIRMCDISVYLEGNVIDLGAMTLQVAEACSGLRYLFPLMALGFIVAYFYEDRMWKRVVLFLSTIPITVLMNSLRIGLIGVTVEYWGPSMAEGFLHDFEGWVVFMTCTAVLLGEMWILSRFFPPHRPLRETFGIDLPAPTPERSRKVLRGIPLPYKAALGMVAIAAVVTHVVPAAEHIRPKPRPFMSFPMALEGWTGYPERIENIYLEELQLTDYILANYVDAGWQKINLYVSYYDQQRDGNTSVHTPRACLPGDGWEIESFSRHEVPESDFRGKPLVVNRAVIEKRGVRQLVYYWFQQRGRNVTDEHVVKVYILWDALTRRRSDGGMVRLVTPVAAGESVEKADARLGVFVQAAMPSLRQFIPE